MALLALKVDVDTWRGTREGVPRLVELFRRHGAGATFLWSLGPDHTGRAIRRVLRPGFFGKVKRTSVVSHYGVRTLLNGTLLPGPDIGARGARIMRGVRDQGYECGIHCFDHVRWQDGVMHHDARWTAREMDKAVARFRDALALRADFAEADIRLHGVQAAGDDWVAAEEAYLGISVADRESGEPWLADTYWLSDIATQDEDPARARAVVVALERSIARINAWIAEQEGAPPEAPPPS